MDQESYKKLWINFIYLIALFVLITGACIITFSAILLIKNQSEIVKSREISFHNSQKLDEFQNQVLRDHATMLDRVDNLEKMLVYGKER